jgi:hypothetical protein
MTICVSERVAMDSLKFHPGPAQPFYALQAGQPRNGLTAVSGVARLPVTFYLLPSTFYPFGHPTPYASVNYPHAMIYNNLHPLFVYGKNVIFL